MLANIGNNGIQILNEDAASTAANRFLVGGGSPLFLSASECALFRYDTTLSRWMAMHNADMTAPAFGTPVITSYADFNEIAPPTSPAANVGRLYAKDVSSITKLAYKDSAGTETIIQATIPNRAYSEYTTNADLSTVLPADDTVPQITEGVEILTGVVTPTSVNSRVRVTFHGFVTGEDAAAFASAALFRDAVANALCAVG